MNSIRKAICILKCAALSPESKKDLEEVRRRWKDYIEYVGNNRMLYDDTHNNEIDKAAPVLARILKERYGGDLNNSAPSRKYEGWGSHLQVIAPALAGGALGYVRRGSKGIENPALGALGGMTAGLATSIAGVLAGRRSKRTLKEQFDYDEKPSLLKNLLLPGYAAYNSEIRNKLYKDMLEGKDPE